MIQSDKVWYAGFNMRMGPREEPRQRQAFEAIRPTQGRAYRLLLRQLVVQHGEALHISGQ